MNRLFWIGIAALTVTFGSCHKGVFDSGVWVTEERVISENYHGVLIESAIDVVIIEDASFSLKIEGGENKLPFIETKVIDGHLVLSEKRNHIRDDKQVRIFISQSHLSEISIEGSGDITGDDIWASDYEKTRKEGRAMTVASNVYLEIDNQYGNVEIESIGGDSLIIDVSIKVLGDDMEDVEELMDLININIRESSSFVLVETLWAEDASFFKKSFLDLSQTFGSKDLIQVDYKIKVPRNMSIEINNRFGDVYMGDHDGAVELNLSYGDFRAHKLTQVKSMKAKYGKLKVKEIGGAARLDVKFMDSVEIDEAEEVYIKSTSSEIEIEKVGKLHLNCNHDEIRVEEAGEVTGTISLSDLEIDELTEKLDLTTKYGEVHLRNVDSAVTLVNIEGAYTDFQIGFDPTFSSKYTVQITENREFSKGENVSVDDQLIKNEFITYYGSIGTGDAQRVSIITRSGFVKFTR